MTMQDTVRVGENVLAHIVAIVLGLVMMIVGIGMGVTIMLLPVALPLGLVGLGLFIWGVTRDKARRRKQAGA
ncbi:MAG: hypothetical protein ACYTF8_07360 [Planctomycetota bacterium]|jgi:hypothetical protein